MAMQRLTSKVYGNRILISQPNPKIFVFFATISIAIILLFIIRLDIFHISDPSTYLNFQFHSKDNGNILKAQKTDHQLAKLDEIPSISSIDRPLGIDKSTTDSAVTDEHDPFIPPANIKTEERIEWFRRKLPEFDILNSDRYLTARPFHGRVLEFLSHGCKIRFYMTWLMPAKLFGERQFLTMDSLFKTNPKACLVIISTSLDSITGYRILKPLLDRGFRILAIAPDLPFLAKNTPAENWLTEMKSGTKDPGSVPLSQNLSNLIRLLMLYRYGGVYLDTDILVLRDFSGMRNSIGAQSTNPVTREWIRLNGAIMVFDIFHPLLLDFLQEFASNFDGNRWGYNGPYLVSRVIERIINNISWKGYENYNFTVLPQRAFYPVNWLNIGKLMKKPETELDSRWSERIWKDLKNEQTYTLHLWYRESKDYKIEDGSVVARLISDHCIVCNKISS